MDGRFIPSPSEGGHADFAARTEREIALLRDLTARFGRAEVEQVVSGQGSSTFTASHTRHPAGPRSIRTTRTRRPPSRRQRSSGDVTTAWKRWTCSSSVRSGSRKSGARRCGHRRLLHRRRDCAEDPAGADDGRFLKAFRDKAPFESMLAKMPVKVMLNAEAGLLGAAVFGAEM